MVASVCDSEHALNCRGAKDEPQRFADGGRGKPATLSRTGEREANLRVTRALSEKQADIAEKGQILRLGDSDLSPVTWPEERRRIHLFEESQGLSIWHRRPVLVAPKLGVTTVGLKGS